MVKITDEQIEKWNEIDEEIWDVTLERQKQEVTLLREAAQDIKDKLV